MNFDKVSRKVGGKEVVFKERMNGTYSDFEWEKKEGYKQT